MSCYQWYTKGREGEASPEYRQLRGPDEDDDDDSQEVSDMPGVVSLLWVFLELVALPGSHGPVSQMEVTILDIR